MVRGRANFYHAKSLKERRADCARRGRGYVMDRRTGACRRDMRMKVRKDVSGGGSEMDDYDVIDESYFDEAPETPRTTNATETKATVSKTTKASLEDTGARRRPPTSEELVRKTLAHTDVTFEDEDDTETKEVVASVPMDAVPEPLMNGNTEENIQAYLGYLMTRADESEDVDVYEKDENTIVVANRPKKKESASVVRRNDDAAAIASIAKKATTAPTYMGVPYKSLRGGKRKKKIKMSRTRFDDKVRRILIEGGSDKRRLFDRFVREVILMPSQREAYDRDPHRVKLKRDQRHLLETLTFSKQMYDHMGAKKWKAFVRSRPIEGVRSLELLEKTRDTLRLRSGVDRHTFNRVLRFAQFL